MQYQVWDGCVTIPIFETTRWMPVFVSNRLKMSGETNSIKVMLTKVGVAKPQKAGLPASVDLRAWCSPVEDQKNLGSCTANAGVGVVEYFERRAFR